MKTLISDKYKHLLYRDELGDDFILLKYGEVFKYSKNILRLYCWNKKMSFQLKKMGVILNQTETDDKLYILDVKTENLPLLISLGAFKRRPNKQGKWIKSKEKKLGHKILPYRYIKFIKTKKDRKEY